MPRWAFPSGGPCGCGVTKTPEKGDNDVTDEARREAARTGKDVCQILAEMLRKAKRAKDKARQRKIVRAQKYLGCRNKRKRGRRS
jgi:hypothetical protein